MMFSVTVAVWLLLRRRLSFFSVNYFFFHKRKAGIRSFVMVPFVEASFFVIDDDDDDDVDAKN